MTKDSFDITKYLSRNYGNNSNRQREQNNNNYTRSRRGNVTLADLLAALEKGKERKGRTFLLSNSNRHDYEY
jgi:hypothetical protein